jgi:Zn-dependent membrane protease YugP
MFVMVTGILLNETPVNILGVLLFTFGAVNLVLLACDYKDSKRIEKEKENDYENKNDGSW